MRPNSVGIDPVAGDPEEAERAAGSVDLARHAVDVASVEQAADVDQRQLIDGVGAARHGW